MITKDSFHDALKLDNSGHGLSIDPDESVTELYELAKKMAIEFASHCSNYMTLGPNDWINHESRYTTEELFNIYIKENK